MPNPPNYAAGLLLNMALPGSGFSYLGRWGWHLAWFGIFGIVAFQSIRGVALYSNPYYLVCITYLLMTAHYSYIYLANRSFLYSATITAPYIPFKITLISVHVMIGILTWPIVLILVGGIELSREQARFDKAPHCALSLVHFEKLYRASHATFATVQQLKSLYTPDCKSSPQIIQLVPPTDLNFSISVKGENEDMVWKVNKDGLY